jgi:hypothetical protein
MNSISLLCRKKAVIELIIKNNMKKLFIIAAVCFIMGLTFTSCNNEVCPAYGQADVEQPAELG